MRKICPQMRGGSAIIAGEVGGLEFGRDVEIVVEGFGEIVDAFKILDGVVRFLLHPVVFDHEEDQLAKIARTADVPGTQDGKGHESPTLQGQLAKTFAELGAADVAAGLGVASSFGMEFANGVGKTVPDEADGVDSVAAVFADDLLNGFFGFLMQ